MIANIGRGMDRVDGREKVTGSARFAAEHHPKGLVWGVLVPATIASGTIRSIDTRAALEAPGVIAVYTHRNAPKLLPVKTQVTGGAAGEARLPLSDATIRYAGQHIALVLAESFEQATWAASLVRVAYTARPPRVTLAEHAHEGVPKAMWGSPEAKRGDADAALAAAQVRIDHVYTTPIEHHNMMEPHALVAEWSDGKLTVQDSTQWITGSQETLAAAFGLPLESVRVISQFVGGGFGCKGQVWPHMFLAVAAAKDLGRPVKVVLTRKQLYTSNGHRSATEQRVALGATREGKLTAIVHDSVAHTSMSDSFIEPCTLPTRMMYATPNLHTLTRVVPLHQPMPTYTRAPGETPGMFALESAVDELAVELGIDPVRLREINHADVDPESGKPWSSKSLLECTRRAGERFGWSRRSPKPRSMREGRDLIGWGMASATYPAYQVEASAKIRLFADGGVVVECGAQEIGVGTATVLAQVAAAYLGIPVERVRFEIGDTRLPRGPVAGGSTQAASAGSAVKGAALALARTIADLAVADPASPLHGADPERVAHGEGHSFLESDPSKRESWVSLLARNYLRAVEADFDAKPHRGEYSTHAFGAHFVEVRVDEDLAIARATRVVSAFAGGRILNAKTARSQYLGGIVQGIGMALLEKTHIDENLARYTNANLAEYLVPVNADIVAIEPILVEEVDEHVNPIGAKGIGEIGIVGVAAAVANAVYHATGKRVRDLPITIEKLL